jgi:hypothetical protein
MTKFIDEVQGVEYVLIDDSEGVFEGNGILLGEINFYLLSHY